MSFHVGSRTWTQLLVQQMPLCTKPSPQSPRPSLISVDEVKYPEKMQCSGGKGLFSLQFQDTVRHWGEVKAGNQDVSHTTSTIKMTEEKPMNACWVPHLLLTLSWLTFFAYQHPLLATLWHMRFGQVLSLAQTPQISPSAVVSIAGMCLPSVLGGKKSPQDNLLMRTCLQMAQIH